MTQHQLEIFLKNFIQLNIKNLCLILFLPKILMKLKNLCADLLIIDDPHSEQDAMSASAFDNAYEWYTSGPRQRLQPGAKVVLVMTRWSKKDLTGILLNNQKDVKGDQWDLVEFPAILDHGSKKEPVWPQYWKLDELEMVKATLPVGKWNAQWMQEPTSEEGALIKREWWNKWEEEFLPDVTYVIQSYTEEEKNETKRSKIKCQISNWSIWYEKRWFC